MRGCVKTPVMVPMTPLARPHIKCMGLRMTVAAATQAVVQLSRVSSLLGLSSPAPLHIYVMRKPGIGCTTHIRHPIGRERVTWVLYRTFGLRGKSLNVSCLGDLTSCTKPTWPVLVQWDGVYELRIQCLASSWRRCAVEQETISPVGKRRDWVAQLVCGCSLSRLCSVSNMGNPFKCQIKCEAHFLLRKQKYVLTKTSHTFENVFLFGSQ